VSAQKLGVSISAVTMALRGLALAVPVVAAAFAYLLCRDLHAEKPLEEARLEGEPAVAPAEEPPDLVTAQGPGEETRT
jgi:hypothetical protein